MLLNLYKLNPLKHSNVFQTFSNSILLPAQDGRSNVLNFNSNESREKENSTNTKLKSREVINNAAHKTPDHHLYIEEVTPENFTPGQFLSKLVSMNGMDVDFKENIDTSINLGSKEKHDRATSFDDFPGNENTTKAFSEYRFSEYRVSNNTNHKPESRIKIMDNFFDMKGNSKADYDGVPETVVFK